MKRAIYILIQIGIITIIFLSLFLNSNFNPTGFATNENQSNATADANNSNFNMQLTPAVRGDGGGGMTTLAVKEDDLEMTIDSVIYITQNIPKNVLLKVTNTGQEDLTNISLILNGLDELFYRISPKPISSLKIGEAKSFDIQFSIINMSGEKSLNYTVQTGEFTKKESGKIVILNILDYIRKEIERLTARIEDVENKVTGNNVKAKLSKCEDTLDLIKSQMDIENYIDAKNNIQVADDCIDNVMPQISGPFSFNLGYFSWLILGGLLAIIILIVIIVIYRVSHNKSNRLKKQKVSKLSDGGIITQVKPYLDMNERMIEENSYKDRLKRIEDKLKDK